MSKVRAMLQPQCLYWPVNSYACLRPEKYAKYGLCCNQSVCIDLFIVAHAFGPSNKQSTGCVATTVFVLACS